MLRSELYTIFPFSIVVFTSIIIITRHVATLDFSISV